MFDNTLQTDQLVGLSVRNLTVKTKPDSIAILNDISFDLPKNSLMAIMGGSGSGKTTLLNVLSQRTNVTYTKLDFSGKIVYDNDANSTIDYAYMQQTDTFLPGLTMFETLKFQADLRLNGVTDAEKVALINSLLEVLELTHRKDDTISSFTNKTTLSGGEQRRVSVAIQLLSKPSLFFLDEPTTGLDSSSSLKLVQHLKKLTKLGITVILSIHQPRPEICELFDKICLLSKGGRLVYYGNLCEATLYFKNVSKNPIEYIVDLSVKDTTTQAEEERTEKQIQTMVEDWKQHDVLKEIDLSSTFESNLKLFKRHLTIPFWKELIILTKRSFILTYRDWMSITALNGGSILFAITLGWMFYKPYPDAAGIRSITSSLYVMLEVLGFCPSFYELERLWYTDGHFFLREYSEGYVSIPGFIISRRFAKFFLEDGPVSILFAVITYFMWGLRSGGHYLGIYITVAILIQLMGMVLAMFIFAVSSNFSAAALIYSALYQLQNSACGYFINARTMPVYVRWTKYIAYFWYAFGALVANQYSDWMGSCPYDNEAQCEEYTGNYQLRVLGYPQGWIGEPIGILVVWFIGFQLAAWVVLRFRSFDIKFAKTKTNKIGGEEEGDIPDVSLAKSPESEEEKTAVGIEVELEDISLMKKDLVILDSINAVFSASSINVIMGPSGSGKTSLLNYLSDRISKWSLKSTGRITVNNTLITPSQLKQLSAYVTQHDSLISTLTVRETLYYQARLRLPVEEHPEIPKIINRLIRQMGLSDCADTLVGSDLVKGISGGEKRRVSIAIQLLCRPKILFLDEPTSGLDSKTAVTILRLLEKLASESSTTIIITIHQPNEEMFLSFGSLLLLARGGKVVYNGAPSKIAQYLSNKGFAMPAGSNIADYLLDVVSGGVGENVQTVYSRVVTLVNDWKSNEKAVYMNHDSFDFSQYYHQRSPLSITLPTILRRQCISTIRDSEMLITRAGQVFFVSVIHTLFFAPLKNLEDGIANRLGLIQEVLNFYYVGLINNIAVYPLLKELFYQEYRDGVYGVTEFSLAYFLNELPAEIVPCIFFSALIVFGAGLPRTAGMFFTMLLTCVLAINIGESLGIIFNSLFNHLGVATNILTNLIILAIFMGGTMSINMPGFFKGINYINPMKYAVGVNAVLGFENQEFTCLASECTFNNGEQVLQAYNLDINLGAFFGGLVACFVVYRLVATTSIWIRVKYFL